MPLRPKGIPVPRHLLSEGIVRFRFFSPERVVKAAVFPLLFMHGKESAAFEKVFTARFGRRPDYLAAYTYDAVNILVDAIRKAGLNRALIHDAVRSLSPWQGVTGQIRWDPLGSNTRSVSLGTIRCGHVQKLSQKISAGSLGSRF